MNLLLNVKRRRIDDEIRPVLLILAAPCELRVRNVDVSLGGGFLDLSGGDADARSLPYELRIEVFVARTLRPRRQRVAAAIDDRLERLKLLRPLRGGLQFGGRDV